MKIYACINATNISRKFMKIAKAIEIGATRTLLKTKIRPIKAKMTICPAVIFANKRTVKAKALAKSPRNSTMNITGATNAGTPCGTSGRQPEVAGEVRTSMIISTALKEGVTLFAEVLCIILAFKLKFFKV